MPKPEIAQTVPRFVAVVERDAKNPGIWSVRVYNAAFRLEREEQIVDPFHAGTRATGLIIELEGRPA